eukprot:7388514-Prymnesium_polylepis.2
MLIRRSGVFDAYDLQHFSVPRPHGRASRDHLVVQTEHVREATGATARRRCRHSTTTSSSMAKQGSHRARKPRMNGASKTRERALASPHLCTASMSGVRLRLRNPLSDVRVDDLKALLA